MASRIKITVTEDLQDLKRLYHKHPAHLHSRIRMLYLIKSGVTESTKVLSGHLMVGSRAIQRWKNDYLVGGIDNLLKYEKGKHKSNGIITPTISAVLKEQLSSPTSGFTSYVDLQQWLQENHLPTVTYRVVHHHATVKLKASLKVARKSHIRKDPSAVENFKKQ